MFDPVLSLVNGMYKGNCFRKCETLKSEIEIVHVIIKIWTGTGFKYSYGREKNILYEFCFKILKNDGNIEM